MLPSYERFDTNLPKQRISFGIFSFLLVSLPLFGFIFCVVWSIIHNFESANATHCHVYNVLPSISAAIGNYQPQRFVWQLVIVIHTPGRLLVSYMYIGRYHNRVRKSRRAIATFACILNMVEICCLLGLSLWTSTDHYGSKKNIQYYSIHVFQFKKNVPCYIIQRYINYASLHLLLHQKYICLSLML